MRGPTRLVLSVIVLILVFGAVLLWLASSGSPAPKSTAWSIQPDQFPLGTVLEGSQVEMSLGLFSGRRPAPLPAFLSQLPASLNKVAERAVVGFRSVITKLGLRVRVEAPPFVTVTQKTIALHGSQGPFAVISLRLKTEKPQECRGNLVVHLSGRAYGVTNIIIPLSAKVLSKPTSNVRKVLIAASPYQEYATGNGSDFEPLARITSHLAEQGIRVDFCRTLPNSLSLYRTILLADNEMAGLDPTQAGNLRKFLADGGRLILAADAFFVPTAPSANRLLTPFGLQIVERDAGMSVTNSRVVPDALTAGVTRVDFFRPALINITDPLQGKILVEAEDVQGGYVAVSRQPSRGEIIVLTQSLWWNWIRRDPAEADNSRLLENLLAW